MKRSFTFLVTILFVLSGCNENKQATDHLITVDVTKTYSSRKELILQDFMDVEYVALETKDDFLNQGYVKAIGKKIILVRNYTADGDIFVYDRNGKALRKINRLGQGGEEYTNLYDITLDEDKEELFINDIFLKKILVYDLYGNFKRSFKHKEGNGSQFYTDVFNYDAEHLICYDEYNEEIAFVLVSKQDGSITKEFQTPFKERKFLQQQQKDKTSNMTYTVAPGPFRGLSPFGGNWMLMEHSTDTVYTLLPDYSLHPFLVRTPSIQSMNPEIYLRLRLFSDRYIFMEAIKNEYDWTAQDGFPRSFFVYDRKEQTFFGYIVHNGDYTTKKEIYMNRLRPVDQEIESWQTIEAHELVMPYKNGQLKGQLKEIAATLDQESNPVIMLVKHKK